MAGQWMPLPRDWHKRSGAELVEFLGQAGEFDEAREMMREDFGLARDVLRSFCAEDQWEHGFIAHLQRIAKEVLEEARTGAAPTRTAGQRGPYVPPLEEAAMAASAGLLERLCASTLGLAVRSGEVPERWAPHIRAFVLDASSGLMRRVLAQVQAEHGTPLERLEANLRAIRAELMP